MEAPRDIDTMLKHLLSSSAGVMMQRSQLSADDEAYLTSLIAAVRGGRRAVLIVEEADERLRYMFSNASRPEAVTMLGKVIEATGRRITEGDT